MAGCVLLLYPGALKVILYLAGKAILTFVDLLAGRMLEYGDAL